jgi:D-glycero-D-manno-heptose 1,7-bisphosphate phosphatase
MNTAKTDPPPKPALFLDRDGVLNRDFGYVFRPEDLEIPAGAGQALFRAQQAGFWLIVITNQSGIARGYFTLNDVHHFHRTMQNEYQARYGVTFDGFYICPHHPQGQVAPYAKACQCRKPATGLLEQARHDLPIDWDKSILIGDKASDIECGRRAGLPAIQINQGHYPLHANPWKVVKNLADAIEALNPQDR